MVIKQLIQVHFLLILVNSLDNSLITNPATIPNYLGKSYNLLYGNILSKNIDPGFRHDIFDWTYTKKTTTQDGKYLLPDGVGHSLLSSCTFTSDSQLYRGTQSYKSGINQKASVSGGYKGLINSASFSLSDSYESMQKQTIQQKKTMIHISAECEAYKLQLDIFETPKLTSNFMAGVKECSASGDWTKFIQQFGTHYVYDLILGARTSQQTVYSYTSIQKMSALSIDVKLTAKAKYAAYHMDASFDFKKYTTQMAYSETISSSISEFYIGKQAPRNGNHAQWAANVHTDPMPINVKIYDLGELFKHISGLNVSKAQTSFYTALDKYCSSLNCKTATPDGPTPPPATLDVKSTPAYGGGGGGAFKYSYNTVTYNVKKFVICTDSGLIFSFQMQVGDDVKNLYTPKVGGNGKSCSTWDVPRNEQITQIEMWHDKYVNGLIFITNKGNKSQRFGNTAKGYNLITIPTDYRIIGNFGRSGNYVDQLGFVIAKTLFHMTAGQKVVERNISVEE